MRIALVDCNNFYVSCERVFNPKLRNRAVAVLSNNDGCVVARSNEVKALGVKMGQAAFECRDLFRQHNVIVYSSNYELYGDMSARVMNTLAEFAPAMEIYSIDEAFLDLSELPDEQVLPFAFNLRAQVLRRTGIPISIGIASTKTLAKLANDKAKKTSSGVFTFEKQPLDHLLDHIPVEDVWGIGSRYSAKLANYGITTALQLKNSPDAWVKKLLTICGLRTVWELRGISCIGLDTVEVPNKTIIKSRSFGKPVSELSQLREATATYVSIAAQTLREQKSCAGAIQVFAVTSYFVPTQYRYHATTIVLPYATSYTPELICAAIKGLEKVFVPGFSYKKVGIVLMDIVSQEARQIPLFLAPQNSKKKEVMMRVVDKTNAKWGGRTVFPLACGVDQPWKSLRSSRSQRYTTQWKELLTVHV